MLTTYDPYRRSVPRVVDSYPCSLFLLLILLMGVSSLALAQTKTTPKSDDPQPISIGIIGDQTYSTDIQASYGVLQQGVALLSGKPVDVVLHVGDLTESSNSVGVETALYNQATGILDKLPVPWYLTAGDHDVNPPVYQQDSPDRSREQLFQQLYGQRVPAFLVHPWYSFDMKGYHFIALYSFEALWSDSRFGNIFLSQVYDDQFAFLQADLAAHAHAKGIIVWVHQPLWYHVSGWKRVHELLRQYPVVAVISGHFHYNQDVGVIDGIHYVTVGATGGFKKIGARQAGDVDHVSVLTIGHNLYNLELYALDGLPLFLTPRVDMDRVQALDVQDGNFYDFSQVNVVYSQNGQLVSDCTSGAPALIQIAEIGDPIDLPLDVKITSTTSGVNLTNPQFAAGLCQQVISGTECILKRTVRTFVSNYSSVTTDTFDGPLWSSGITGAVGPGTSLNFNITSTFTGAAGQYFLTTTASTPVLACTAGASKIMHRSGAKR